MSVVNAGKAKSVLSKAFLENIANISEDEAALLVVKSEQRIRALEEERDADEKLAAAKSLYSDLSKMYKSAIDFEKAKITHLVEKITEIQDTPLGEMKE